MIFIKFFRGILNVHASLLPKLRGAAPIIHAIRNGDTKTGVTIMKIRPKHFDIGEILIQQEDSIGADELMPTVHDRLAQLGAKLLSNTVASLPDSLDSFKVQCEDEATYAPKITEEFTRIRWNEMSAKQVYDLYRSLYSFKHATTCWDKEVVKLKEIRLGHENCDLIPGSARFSRKTRALAVTCADAREIEVVSLGIGKRSKISATDFRNGYLLKVEEPLRKFS